MGYGMSRAKTKLVVRKEVVAALKFIESLRRLIRRKFEGFERSLVGFGIGMPFAWFHLFGKYDSFRQPLNK
jgi:hypothetical protein